jgi:hypothetical protein
VPSHFRSSFCARLCLSLNNEALEMFWTP